MMSVSEASLVAGVIQNPRRRFVLVSTAAWKAPVDSFVVVPCSLQVYKRALLNGTGLLRFFARSKLSWKSAYFLAFPASPQKAP
jgi:hypothetical protein